MLINPLNKYKTFTDYLNKALPVKNDYYIAFLNTYNTIQVINKTTGKIDHVFALYDSDKKTIYLPTKNSKWIIYTNLAHEYIHAWQDDNGKEFNENEAEKMSKELYNKFFSY
jgi:Zn-dependent peptidase ImmA (M78 family)